jgi:S1-C subfamily serine protease
VTIAARLNKIYYTGSAVFKESVPYYSVYADYVLSRGIIDSHLDYDTSATRAVFAQIVYKALPAEALPVINTIADYGICDVMPDAGYGSAVYALYRAGILTGSDRYGTFFPDSNITRAEACAIMVRLADKATRITTKLPVKIPAEDIFLRCTDAVFTLETFDSDGDSIRTGSGFFISDTGLAVTALHVFENAASATVTLVSGSIYPVLGLYDTDEKYNLALFPIDAGDAVFHYLNLADSDLVEAGNTVYALGNPRNLVNTITDGIISNVGRIVDEDVFIQFTAPISFGSGGGPILNTLCQVVGVTSISFSHGQNLNFAIPVNYIKELQPGELVTLDKFLFNDA